MKPADRQRLYDALMADTLEVCEDDPMKLLVLEEVVTGDLDTIEPIIDEIIAREKQEH